MAADIVPLKKIEKVLNILEEKFQFRAKDNPSDSHKIEFLVDDLNQSNLRIEDLDQVMIFLETNYPELKKISVYDYTNEEPPSEPLELDVNFHKVAEFQVPSDFANLLKTIRAHLATSVVPSTKGAKAYWIKIEERQIILNDSFILSKPDFDSENDIFFGHVYARPGEIVRKTDIKLGLGVAFKKSFHQIIRDLKFRNGLQGLFFPSISSAAVIFRNPVYEKDIGMKPKELNALKQYIKSLQAVGKTKK